MTLHFSQPLSRPLRLQLLTSPHLRILSGASDDVITVGSSDVIDGRAELRVQLLCTVESVKDEGLEAEARDFVY